MVRYRLGTISEAREGLIQSSDDLLHLAWVLCGLKQKEALRSLLPTMKRDLLYFVARHEIIIIPF